MISLRKLLLASIIPYALASNPLYHEKKSASTIQSNNLEQRIGHLAKVDIVNPQGEGAIYLIGQVHADPVTTKDGVEYKGTQESALVQAQVYHILLRLRPQLAIGEGLPNREFTFPMENLKWSEAEIKFHKNGFERSVDFTREYFALNPKQVAYSAWEMLNPQTATYGIDDKKEMQRVRELDKQQFSLAEPISSAVKDTLKMVEFANQIRSIRTKKKNLHDQRSRIYMRESVAIADRLKQPEVTIIIGAAHLPLMTQEYGGSRKLYIIWPRGITTGSTNLYKTE